MTLSKKQTAVASVVILFVFALILFAMGRIPIGERGFGIWTWDAWSTDTSQLFGDPYSFSHVLHGILFFAALWPLRRKISLEYRFLIALFIEVAWEIFENTPFTIERYRAVTASLDYYGDSILNSVGDALFAMLGFWIAAQYLWWISVGVFLVIELLMLVIMRDNLTLNIVMLIYPVDAIREWQLQ